MEYNQIKSKKSGSKISKIEDKISSVIEDNEKLKVMIGEMADFMNEMKKSANSQKFINEKQKKEMSKLLDVELLNKTKQ